jgi:hypothetical protein
MEVSAGRAIVDVLKAEGVKAVFGIPGDHTLGIYDALYDTPEVASARAMSAIVCPGIGSGKTLKYGNAPPLPCASTPTSLRTSACPG